MFGERDHDRSRSIQAQRHPASKGTLSRPSHVFRHALLPSSPSLRCSPALRIMAHRQPAKTCQRLRVFYPRLLRHARPHPSARSGRSDESNLPKLVESFKQETGVEFARRTHRRLWQFKYYDRILRASDRADRVAWYIWQNPVRKGFCHTPTHYPFLGSFTEVGAKMLRGPVASEWTPPWKREGTQNLVALQGKSCRAEDRGATLKPIRG